MMKIVQSIMTNNPCYKAGRKITVKGLMLHSVGCPQPSAQVFINTFNKSSYSAACVHGFIDANTGTIYQTLPWNHRGWHGGSGYNGCCNNTHIGIEMCEPAQIKYTTGGRFTCSDSVAAKSCVKRTYDSAVELFAYLCKQYRLNPLTDICSHKEGYAKGIATNHGDPEHLWNGLGTGYNMDGFRKAVMNKMNNKGSEDDEMTTEERTKFNELVAAVSDLTAKVDELAKPKMIYNYIDNNIPAWALDAVKWAKDSGIIDGDEHGLLQLDDTKLWMLVVLYRASKNS